jgi:hypothetical protein
MYFNRQVPTFCTLKMESVGTSEMLMPVRLLTSLSTLNQVVTLLYSIWKVFGMNLSQDMGYTG